MVLVKAWSSASRCIALSALLFARLVQPLSQKTEDSSTILKILFAKKRCGVSSFVYLHDWPRLARRSSEKASKYSVGSKVDLNRAVSAQDQLVNAVAQFRR